MHMIKMFLIAVLVLTCVAGGVYYVSLHNSSLQLPTQLASLTQLTPSLPGNLRIATDRLPDIKQIGSVLGIKTEIKKGESSLPQKTFETVRYNYCQEVIKDYEQRYETESIPR